MRENMLFLQLWILIFSHLGPTRAATNTTTTADTYDIFKAPTITKPGCPTKCGNLTVPYPFGISVDSGCGIGKLLELNCTDATESPSRALIGDFQFYDISDNYIHISNVVSRWCYDRSGSIVRENEASSNIRGTPYSYSNLNKFYVVGCDDFELVRGAGSRNFTSGCVTLCSNTEDVISSSCAC